MMIYRLNDKILLKTTLDQAWVFFSDPHNLNEITPADLSFEILWGADRKMYPGQIITYKVSPFPFFKTTWVTEITHVKEKEMFVDEQRFGPYSFWHHQHLFKETGNGVLAEDIVHYKVPLGFLGDIANAFIVKNKLKQIFDYRHRKLIEIFNNC